MEAQRARQIELRFYELGADGPVRHAVGRRTLSHAFEATKMLANANSQQRQEALPAQRFAAAGEWQLRRHMERAQQDLKDDQLKAKAAHEGARGGQLPVFQTSRDNPLSNAPPSSSEDDEKDSSDSEDEQQGEQLDAGGAGSHGGSRSHSARRGRCRQGDSRSRGGSPEALRALSGSLATGSLAPTGAEPANVRAQAAVAAMHAVQEQEQFRRALLLQFPHGIPKKMLRDLREMNIEGVPTLGYGCPESSSQRETALLRVA